MGRKRMTMTSLLAGTALLCGAMAAAQGHDPTAAAARARAQQSRASPEERAREMAERQAFLQRLVGRFHATSVETSYRSGTVSSFDSADTQPVTVFNSSSVQTQGRAECVELGTDHGVSCLLDLRTKQGASSATAFRVTLPPPDASSLAQQLDGAFEMGMVSVTRMRWASLEGDTAIFKAECLKAERTGGGKRRSSQCGRQVRITARPDGSRVRVLVETANLRNTLLDLNRARRPDAAEAEARRSGQ